MNLLENIWNQILNLILAATLIGGAVFFINTINVNNEGAFEAAQFKTEQAQKKAIENAEKVKETYNDATDMVHSATKLADTSTSLKDTITK